MNRSNSTQRASSLVREELTQLEAYLNGLPEGLQHTDAFIAYRHRRNELNHELEMSEQREHVTRLIEQVEWKSRIWVLAATAAIMCAITLMQFFESSTISRIVGAAGTLIAGFAAAILGSKWIARSAGIDKAIKDGPPTGADPRP